MDPMRIAIPIGFMGRDYCPQKSLVDEIFTISCRGIKEFTLVQNNQELVWTVGEQMGTMIS